MSIDRTAQTLMQEIFGILWYFLGKFEFIKLAIDK